jgi:hypothetical protein
VVHHEEPDLSKTKPEFHGLKRAKAVIPPARAFGWILGHDDDD